MKARIAGLRTGFFVAILAALFDCGIAADDGTKGGPEAVVATSAWQALEGPVYTDPEDDWAKDPSIIKAGDTYYMFYTSANPWQDTGAGGKGEPRIDYATSPDGLKRMARSTRCSPAWGTPTAASTISRGVPPASTRSRTTAA